MLELNDNFTDAQAQELENFLAAPERPQGTMGYLTLAGFLFAVSYSPEVIMPSDWMPVVFGGHDPNYQNQDELRAAMGAMLSLFNFVGSGPDDGHIQLPPGCEVNDATMSNFDYAPLSQWAAGFVQGHTWLEASWEAVIPEEMEEELNANILMLSFFANRKFAEEFFHEARHDGVSKIEDKSFDEFAARVLHLFPAAMENYAAMGRSIFQSLMKLGLYDEAFADGPEPGRNDPCPCGSGRKFKKCCGE